MGGMQLTNILHCKTPHVQSFSSQLFPSSEFYSSKMDKKQTSFTEYHVGLVPGPTSVGKHVLVAYSHNYASADVEDTFFELYALVQEKLASLLDTRSGEETPIIMLGEGMLALWSGLKSCVSKGDRVLALSNGENFDIYVDTCLTIARRHLWAWCWRDGETNRRRS